MAYGAFFWCVTALLVLLAGGTRWLYRCPPGAWRSWLMNAALVLMALLAPLAAAEGCFLFFIDSTDTSLASLASRRWQERHLSGLRAYRGRHDRSQETPGKRRLSIAVVGDSITFGQGIARELDLYPSLLERTLRERGVSADVFNISGSGWNLPEELGALWKSYKQGAKYDIVVLGFCLNDLGQYVAAAPGFQEDIARLSKPPALLAPLVRNSFVASYVYYRYAYIRSSAIKQSWDKVAEAYHSPEAFLPLAKDLGALKRFVEGNGARLVVLTFPDSSIPWERYPYRDFHKRLEDYWTWIKVPHVDLLPVFERYPSESLRVSFMESHPNERAHALAAAELTQLLARLLGLSGAAAETALGK